MVAKKAKSKVKTAKQDRAIARLASDGSDPGRKIHKNDTWRKIQGEKAEFQGITVFAAVDPYKSTERKEFRSAMNNPYVYRASRIHATFTTGQGYTTDVVPRKEEEIPDEELDNWQKTMKIKVPYFNNREMTPEQINDFIDKKALDMDLATNVFNAYFTSLEQGRCVLALTPLEPDEEGKFKMPEMIRLIRPEFTERPVINEDTSELEGCRIIGVKSPQRNNILPKNRMIYIMHGFNNELFSDYYGDSKVARIADEANTLNIILNQDYERAAESTWYKPPIYSVPIPPQEYGNEDSVLNDFLGNANDSKGQSIAVTGPSTKDEVGVTVLNTPPASDLSGLEIVRTGLIKAIITAYGLPGFMLAEGDIGKLGGNANIEEVDSYINQEIRPERIILENTIEKQFFDVILAILFDVDDATQIPVRIKFQFNKPKLVTLLTPDMFAVLTQMAQFGFIDESGIRDILGLEELDKETLSKGAAGGGQPGHNLSWPDGRRPIETNLWPNEMRRMQDQWDSWPDGTPDAIKAQWPNPKAALWSQAGSVLQSARKNKRVSAV
jgi:hypothetical protein